MRFVSLDYVNIFERVWATQIHCEGQMTQTLINIELNWNSKSLVESTFSVLSLPIYQCAVANNQQM